MLTVVSKIQEWGYWFTSNVLFKWPASIKSHEAKCVPGVQYVGNIGIEQPLKKSQIRQNAGGTNTWNVRIQK